MTSPSVSTVSPLGIKKPWLAYFRLTVDRDGNKIGYEVQKSAVDAWAVSEGIEIAGYFYDKDITAADLAKVRPGYEEMLDTAATGDYGGVAVWRLDRLVRLMFEFERSYHTIHKADGYIVSVQEKCDSRTPMGRFYMQMMVALAEMEIATMKIRSKGHRQQRAKDGMVNGGGPRPFGFLGTHNAKGEPYPPGTFGIEWDKKEIALMQDAANRIAWEGVTWSDIVKEWFEQGVRGTTGAVIQVQTLQRMLTSYRAVGQREVEIVDPETGETSKYTVPAKWQGPIDRKTWERLRSLIIKKGSKGPQRQYLLSGFALCGRCGNPLTGMQRHYEKKGKMTTTLTYRCRTGAGDRANGVCGRLSVVADEVDKLVLARVFTILAKNATFIETMADRDSATDTELVAALRTVDDCETQLQELAQLSGQRKADGTRVLSLAEWMAARGEVEREKEAAEMKARRLSQKVNSFPLPNSEDRKNLPGWFANLKLSQQQALVRAFVSEVTVKALDSSGRYFDPKRVVVTPRNPEQLDG